MSILFAALPNASAQDVPASVLADTPKPNVDEPVVPRTAVRQLGLHVENNRGGDDASFPYAVPFQRQYGELTFDLRGAESPGKSTVLVYDGRVKLQEVHNEGSRFDGGVRLDIREAALRQAIGEDFALVAGRVNVKSGVGYAFNPTDFLGRFSNIDATTMDPMLLRDTRLGTGVLQYGYLSDTTSTTLTYAPRLARAAPLGSSPNGWSLQFGKTNSENRLLLKSNVRLAKDFEPELLAYYDGSNWTGGANLTYGLGNSTVLFSEITRGASRGLVADAARYAVRSGESPDNATANGAAIERTSLSSGANLALASGVVIQLVYNYFGGGLTENEWRNWIGVAKNVPRGQLGQVWYFRSYAFAIQAPVMRQNAFVRVDMPKLRGTLWTWSAFANVSLPDRSALLDVEAAYPVDERLKFTLSANANVGGRETVYGSLPQRIGIAAGAKYTF